MSSLEPFYLETRYARTPIANWSNSSRNGRTTGIAQPSAEYQESVIRRAYGQAKLDMSETDYVECHGTGTSVGDAIEVEALGRCFSPRQGLPLMIGSVMMHSGPINQYADECAGQDKLWPQ